MPSYKELVASRESRKDSLRKEYLGLIDTEIENRLDEEEDRQQFAELSAEIVEFGKRLANTKLKPEHPIMYRSSKKACRRRRGALLCPGIFLDKNGVIYMSIGKGPYFEGGLIGAPFKRQVPHIVIPITTSTDTAKAVSLAEIKLVSKKLRDHVSIDWEYTPSS